MTKWSLGALVGKGGSAQVRIVTSKDAGIPATRKYCAKIIHLHALQKYERNAALRECKLLRSIPPHQHILRMFDCFRLDGRLYIITEYCEGGDLHQHLRALRATRAGLTDLEVWHYFNQVVSAVSHLHALNILHRDIKSKNIFLDKEKKLLKLGDFGISKQLSSISDLTSTAVGTPNSMSPELCSGKQYSFSSDIWSMGCLLFELCTSRYPFEASRLSELLRQICSDEPEWVQLGGRSFELNETTKGLLQKSIEKRITLVQLCEKVRQKGSMDAGGSRDSCSAGFKSKFKKTLKVA
ncbi:kinase-like domain-containing protein [Chytriomyces cf. hyalinus JEL632]|nr:kinase-like domain-containing protein [Chytriomyces cf. hyalinus JEL632]